MNESLLLTIQAVVWMVVGLAFIFIPIRWRRRSTSPLTAAVGSSPASRAVSSSGFAVLDWLARDQDPATLGPIIVGNLVANAISVAVHLNAVTTRLHNPLGWGPVALTVALTLGWITALA